MADSTKEERDVRDDLIAKAREAIPGLTERRAAMYSRLMFGKTTLAYVWHIKGGIRIDLYLEPNSLPKSLTGFKAGRGRARKEGLLAVLTGSSGKRDISQVVDGLKVAAQYAGEQPKPEGAGDEFSTDLKEGAKAADAKAAKPDPKKREKVGAKS